MSPGGMTFDTLSYAHRLKQPGLPEAQVKHIANDLKQYGHVEHFQRGTITAPPAGKPQTLLLVGSDRRFGDARGDARSDTMMLVRLDPKSNATTVLDTIPPSTPVSPIPRLAP